MHEAAARIAAGSAFVPQDAPFTVSVIGSLHKYSDDAVATAARSSPATVRGRFVKWEISRAKLRAAIEIEGAQELLACLQRELPRARVWDSHYVTVGSVAGIETARHDEFLEAVNAAFPLDAGLIFTLGGLELARVAPQHVKTKGAKPMPKKKGQPAPAPPSIAKQARKRRTASPHMKWERRPGATGQSIVDEMIKTAATGAGRIRASAQATHAAASRTSAVKAARKVSIVRE